MDFNNIQLFASHHSSKLPSFFKKIEYSIIDKERHLICGEEVGLFLAFILHIQNPIRILEVGTHVGYGTLILAHFSCPKSTIISIEKEKNNIIQAEKNIKQYAPHRNITFLHGDAFDILERTEKTFDFIFIDASKRKTLNLFNMCYQKLTDNGVIIVDNALYHNMVVNSSTSNLYAKGMSDFNKALHRNNNIYNQLLSIGDGVQVIWKKPIP